jgi:starch synthase (maltosyl-transferring)
MAAEAQALDGRRRIVIERLRPAVDDGRFPIKRVVGESVVVTVDVFTDGHDQIACVLCHRKGDADDWQEAPMRAIGNDGWRGQFEVDELGEHCYTVRAWVDSFLTFKHDLARRIDEHDIRLAIRHGQDLVEAAAERAQLVSRRAGQDSHDADRLAAMAASLAAPESLELLRELAQSAELETLMRRYPDRSLEKRYRRDLKVTVDRPKARCSSWYELFPRSAVSGLDEQPGTLTGCIERLPYIARMGFDVLYLPPIHPIGRRNRKGPNNELTAAPDDPGSPWAIGAAEGGHKQVHPELGTLEDFRKLVEAARGYGIEVALDIAFQCAPDHPYVQSHPEWFRHRPDGTIQYAENPPKKYQDIYPFDFETEDWQALWDELASVFEFWIEQGVRIFRVDNPHTKPFGFWEWAIARIKRRHPDVVFLSEAFTRPRIMHRLAKLGFTQSYTYFTWRNSKRELTDYLTELSQHDSREYFRPNLWPNTPDILHEYLQFGGRPAFVARVTLAATLSANYGIYGPAFELLEREPKEPGSEEYLNSEKYEVRQWDLGRAESLHRYIARLNRIRRDNAALQTDWNLRFHGVDNEELICYSKTTADLDNIIVTVVNLDPHHRQSGFVELPLDEWDMAAGQVYQVHDLLSDARYLWTGRRNYVALDPEGSQAHVFRLRRRIGTEQDFDYFL